MDMERTVEERLADLEGRCMAYEAIICDLIHDAWPLEQHRIERRDSACRAIEFAMGRINPDEHHHLLVQTMLAVVEEAFGDRGPSADEPPA